MQLAFTQMLKELRSIVLLGETGIPSDHALLTEFIARLVAKFLPTGATSLMQRAFSSASILRKRRFGSLLTSRRICFHA